MSDGSAGGPSDLERRMISLPVRRRVVERIDPRNTVVLLLAANLEKAVRHYGAYCNPLPEFRILDSEQGADAVAASARALSIRIGYAGRVWEYLNRQTCLYAPGGSYYGPTGTLQTYSAAVVLGLHEPCLVDREAAVVGRAEQWFDNLEPTIPVGYFEANREAAAASYAAMGDAESKEIYAASLRTRLTGNAGYLPHSEYPQYFHPLVSPEPGDVLIEGGILDGVTTLRFAEAIGQSGRIVAFEPLPESWPVLEERFAPYGNIVLERHGLWSRREKLHLMQDTGASRVRQEAGEGTAPCSLIDLDSYVEENGLTRCDMIKLDIEGAELDALKGSVRTLRTFRPKLAISVYHYPFEQFIDIVNFLANLNLGYTFFMGQHLPMIYQETVLYGRPSDSSRH
ncbi:MAG: FkbM family methyltransferase [Magnetospirillum sp.]|nr:FkbM family methyltransferase [Magnetospirillum sp.]